MAELQRLTTFLSVAEANEEPLLVKAEEQSKRHLRDFVWSFQPVWFPLGPKERKMERAEERENKGSSQCFHSHPCGFFFLLSWSPLGADCHAPLPTVDNQSFLLNSPLCVQDLWASLRLLANGWTQIFGIFPALYINYVRGNFELDLKFRNQNKKFFFVALSFEITFWA